MVKLFGRKEKVDQGLKRSREGWFGRIVRALSGQSMSAEAWDELEEALISSDAGATLTMQILERVRDRSSRDGAHDGESVQAILREEMVRILDGHASSSPLLDDAALSPKPFVVLMVGVNGVGKTTSIAKLAAMLAGQGKKVLLAAGDTFRAAGVEQLDIWASRVNADIISHQQGADPGAVTFDALQAAQARGVDVLIIDTAGRLHTKTNLMEELKKVRRVIERSDPTAPHETILVMDATTGQNGLAQAQHFTEAVGVTGLLLAKLDGTARGGIVLAIADQLRLPILFIGTGEQIDDLAPFDSKAFVEAVFAREA